MNEESIKAIRSQGHGKMPTPPCISILDGENVIMFISMVNFFPWLIYFNAGFICVLVLFISSDGGNSYLFSLFFVFILWESCTLTHSSDHFFFYFTPSSSCSIADRSKKRIHDWISCCYRFISKSVCVNAFHLFRSFLLLPGFSFILQNSFLFFFFVVYFCCYSVRSTGWFCENSWYASNIET